MRFTTPSVLTASAGAFALAIVIGAGTPDRATASATYPIRVETDPVTNEPRPYIHVRSGLDALIARSVFYELVGQAEQCDNGTLGVRSGGIWFLLGDPDNQDP